MQLFDLSGKVAIVTGGNGGIGFGMARGLTRAGAAIAVVGRDQAKSENAAAELRAHGQEIEAFSADVSHSDQVGSLIEAVVARFGRLDILVNNAGINIRKAPEAFTDDEWHQVLDVNLSSAFLCSRAAYPHLKAAGGGKVLNNGSMMSIFGSPKVSAYAASKGGVMQLTKALATAWAADNIQVNCFLPGWINTALTQKAREQLPDLNERVLTRTPCGRWGEISDMEGIAVFLASPASDFITGTAIPVDGGYSVQG